MAEKDKVTPETDNAAVPEQVAKAEKVKKTEVAKEKAKPANKSAKQKAKKEKKGWFRGTWGEMKKVTWPSFGTTVKQTGVVIGVTLAFLLVVTLIDAGLGAIYKSLLKLW